MVEFKRLKDICKLGQYELQCRYLLCTSTGFECAKLTPIKTAIDKKVENGKQTEQGDNCEGIKTSKQQANEKR